MQLTQTREEKTTPVVTETDTPKKETVRPHRLRRRVAGAALALTTIVGGGPKLMDVVHDATAQDSAEEAAYSSDAEHILYTLENLDPAYSAPETGSSNERAQEAIKTFVHTTTSRLNNLGETSNFPNSQETEEGSSVFTTFEAFNTTYTPPSTNKPGLMSVLKENYAGGSTRGDAALFSTEGESQTITFVVGDAASRYTQDSKYIAPNTMGASGTVKIFEDGRIEGLNQSGRSFAYEDGEVTDGSNSDISGALTMINDLLERAEAANIPR